MTTNLIDNVEVTDLFRKDPEETDEVDLEKMVNFYRSWRAKMVAEDKEKSENKKTRKKKEPEQDVLERVA